MSCYFLDQSSAGIALDHLDDRIRFQTYTTINTAFAQYFNGIPDSAIAKHVLSRIVCIFYLVAPFCWWAYGVVNWKSKPWSFLYCSQAVLHHSCPILSHSCFNLLPVCCSAFAWYDLITFSVMSADFDDKNATVLYNKKPSIIIMKYYDLPADWVCVGSYILVLAHLSPWQCFHYRVKRYVFHKCNLHIGLS